MTAMIWQELEKPVAFVLGGGGSLGAMQVGMLEALAEHAIVPDLVVGTSVGAINGAILAADPQGAAHRLAHSWSRLDASGVFPRSVMGPLRALRDRRNHLVSESGLARILSENLPSGASFEHLAVPLHVVTTDAATGEATVISSGSLVSALLASAAIPGIFPPLSATVASSSTEAWSPICPFVRQFTRAPSRSSYSIAPFPFIPRSRRERSHKQCCSRRPRCCASKQPTPWPPSLPT